MRFKHEAREEYRNRSSGFFALLTNEIKDPVQALQIYKDRDAVVQSLNDMKNALDRKHLELHSQTAMESRLFLQFLSLIYSSQVRRSLEEHNMMKSSVEGIMNERESLTEIQLSNPCCRIYAEATRCRDRSLTLIRYR